MYPRIPLGFETAFIGRILLQTWLGGRNKSCPQPRQGKRDGPKDNCRAEEHDDGSPGVLDRRGYRKTMNHFLTILSPVVIYGLTIRGHWLNRLDYALLLTAGWLHRPVEPRSKLRNDADSA